MRAPGLFMSESKPSPENPGEVSKESLPPGPTAQTSATPVKADDLTGDLINGMPDVTNSTPTAPAPIIPANVSELIDGKGVKFNPAIHAANADGTPKTNKFKSFYSKRVGQGKGSTADSPGDASESKTEAPKFAGVDQPAAKPDEAMGAAMVLVPTVDGIMQSLFSDGVALTEHDKQIATPVLAAYMRSKDMKDIPPGIALTMIAVAIYGPKFARPNVKERLTLIMLKLKNMFGRNKTKLS